MLNRQRHRSPGKSNLVNGARSSGSATRRLSDRANEVLGTMIDNANNALAINPAAVHEPQDKPKARFKQATYLMVRQLLQKGHEGDIEKIVNACAPYPPIIGFSTNPFLWAFHALRHSGEVSSIPSDSSLNNMAWQLLYAHRHDIDPCLLVGFLHQTSASTPRKQAIIKENPFKLEPWYVKSL